MAQSLNFEKFAAEGNQFMNELALNLDHPGEQDRAQVGRILKAVLHVLRDRLTIAQSFHVLSQFPMFLKAIYVEDWKYSEKPLKLKTVEDFKEAVKQVQSQLGEIKFDWQMSTEEIVTRVLQTLKKYIPPGQMDDIVQEIPTELKQLFRSVYGEKSKG